MSGTTQVINFNQIPTPWYVPGTMIETVPGYASAPVLPIPARTLIIAQMASGGTATPNAVIQNVTRILDGRGYAGAGSHMDMLITAYLNTQTDIPLDIICMSDAGGATKAVWTYTFAGTATQGGTPAVGIAGTRITIGTLAGDAATVAATEWAAAVNANPLLPVTATVSSAVVTVTAKNGGLFGNEITHILNPVPGDAMPPGLTLTIAQTVTGATNPSIATPLAAVTHTLYTDIVLGPSDTPNLALLNAELERRFTAQVHLDGRGHYGFQGTLSQALSAAAALNARFMHMAPVNTPGTPCSVWAASAAGICSQQLLSDPSRQLDQIAMPGIVGPQQPNIFIDVEQEQLLVGGCSVFRMHADGTVAMKRYVSTYRTNATGSFDTAWFDVMAQAVSARIRYDWRGYFRSVYPTAKLAADGTLAAESDPQICTPKRAKGTWMARKQAYGRLGWITNVTDDDSAWLIDPTDSNRLDYRIPITRIGNLIVDAGQLVMNVI